jgi:hypothetical protein
MKFNSTLSVTLILLLFMLSVGIVSAAGGFVFGRSALKGVTQPVINPILGSNADLSNPAQEGQGFQKESKIIAAVKAEIESTTQPAKAIPASTPKSTPTPTASSSVKAPAEFPMSGQDQGVSLEVRSVERQGENLVLNVALKNDSPRSVQFLYTFLDVTDQQGRALTAVTRNLPKELQPNSPTFVGTISLPLAVMDEGSKQVSISLADYPEQALRLKINQIPLTN